MNTEFIDRKEKEKGLQMFIIEVFKTNVGNRKESQQIIGRIKKSFPSLKVNFDMEDCDKILRIESESDQIESKRIMQIVEDFGYSITILE